MISCNERVSLLIFLCREPGMSPADLAEHLLQHVVNDRLPCTAYFLGEVIS
jgi:hypothetical protein